MGARVSDIDPLAAWYDLAVLQEALREPNRRRLVTRLRDAGCPVQGRGARGKRYVARAALEEKIPEVWRLVVG